MKLNNPILIAALAGGAATIAAFAFTAGADDKQPVTVPTSMETAIFAGGCFWCVESDFDKVDGVVETISGYSGGETTNPTYKTHTKDGHLEVVKVIYDPAKVGYGELVDYFMRHIDPTDAGGQFCDRGNSYTTAIFVEDADEKAVVDAAFADLETSGELTGPIVTAVRPEVAFYAAEDYHQNFYVKSAVRYNSYRRACGRDKRIKEVWSGAK